MKEIKSAKKVNNPSRFGLSPSSVEVKLKLMFTGECAMMPYFEELFQ